MTVFTLWLAAAAETCDDLVDLVGLRLIEHNYLNCLGAQDARGDSRIGSRAELGIGVCRGQDEPRGLAYNLKQLPVPAYQLGDLAHHVVPEAPLGVAEGRQA